jgi:hypothetical protein
MIDIEFLVLNIFDKKMKEYFQPAKPTILPKTPQIPALSGARLFCGLNPIFQ